MQFLPIMARYTRINLPHAVYHIMCRSNMKARLFRGDPDRNRFLYFLKKYAGIFNFRIHAYCLMDTHLHLLAESSRPNLSEFMRRLTISYTIGFHRRHMSRGHVFAGRFRSLVVERGDYMLAASRYIHLNPVEAGICGEAAEYQWSSMKYYKNPENAPGWLYTGEILGWFGNDPQNYSRFVEEGLDEDLKPLVWSQRFVGGREFTRRIQARADELNSKTTEEQYEKFAEEILEKCCRKFKCTPKEFREKGRRTAKMRDEIEKMVHLLRNETDWTYRRIAGHLGISTIYAQMLEKQALARNGKPDFII